MKKLSIVLALLIGLIVVQGVQARSYITVQSTAVCLTSSPATMELYSVQWSSGNPTYGDSFFCLVDSAPTSNVTFGSLMAATVGDYTETKYPVTQQIVPYTVLLTTMGAANGGFTSTLNKLDFTDQNGNGRDIKNGLLLFKLGTDKGTIFTIEYGKRKHQ